MSMIGINPAMLGMMPQGGGQPMLVSGPNGMYVMMPGNSLNQIGSSSTGQNPSSSGTTGQTGNTNVPNMNQGMMGLMNPAMMGMINPMGMNMGMMAMNPNQLPNSSTNPTTQNQGYMIGMPPQMMMNMNQLL